MECPNCGAVNTEGSRFCSTCGHGLTAAEPPARQTRKTVTVLFIDAVSSTELGEQIDIEAVRDVMTRYFELMRQVIEFHGGAVEKFIGDAVMSVFGVPTLHEDDALRACRAAVEIRQRLSELEPQIRADRGVSIEWRMGINTGPAVVGDVTQGQRMVTGDAVNVAARLEAAASPGDILLGQETYQLVRDAITAEPMPPLTLKGKRDPVPAWRLVAANLATDRRARPQDAPLVGRRRPMRLLDDAFRESVEERVCHLFTVLGVAGVGKSRLVDEFVGGIGDEAMVAAGRCLAYGNGITYWPVAEALRGGLGISESATAQEAQAILESSIPGEPDADRIVTAVSNVIGLDETVVSQDELFWAVRKAFEALARRKPLLLVFDDVHWGEPTFLDLIEHIAEWARDAPILLVVMARPDLLAKRPAWGGGKRSATTVQLEALSELESDELVTNLLGATELPSELRVRIGQAAEGNPLFVEEVLAKLIDDGFLKPMDGGGWGAVGDLRDLAIPSTIQALLAARLDSLGEEERIVIESAAVEGKTFHRGAVTALAAEPLRDQIRERLAGLVRMELVRPDQATFVGEEAYRFRHLLIRDAAYQAIAKQSRSELHERFADWLERMAQDRAIEFEEIIAYHLEQAYRYRAELGPPDTAALDLAQRAGNLLADAGERASRRGDMGATRDLLTRAIELLSPGEVRARRLVIHLGPALYLGGEASRAEEFLTGSMAEADAAGDEGASALAATILTAIRESTESTAQAAAIREYDRLASILKRTGDDDGARLAMAWSAFSMFASGHAGEAAERAAALLELGPSDEMWYAEARGTMGTSLVYGPTPVDQAVLMIQELETRSGQSDTPGPMRGLARLRTLRGQFDEARELLARAWAREEELGNRNQLAQSASAQADVEHLAGDDATAARLAIEAFQTLTLSGDRGYSSTIAVSVAEALIGLGDVDEAWKYATIARETSSYDDVSSQAGGRANQARVLSRRGDHDGAERLAREAEAIMAATDYLGQHGQVTEHLAHVLHEAGKEAEAVEAARKARDLYERKGATVLVERVDRLLAEWEAA